MAKRYWLNESDLLTEYVVTDQPLIETIGSLVAWVFLSLGATIQQMFMLPSDYDE
jgi:hypothetical protein